MLAEAGVDDDAEPAAIDECGEGGRRDHLHRGGAHPAAIAARRAAAPPGAAPARPDSPMPRAASRDVRVDLADAHVGVGQQRRQREQGQREMWRVAEADDGQREDGEQGQRRDGPGDVGRDDDEAAAPAGVPEPDARPARATRRPSSTADGRDLQVLGGRCEDAVRVGPVERVVEPDQRAPSQHVHARPSAGAHGISSRPSASRSRSRTRARRDAAAACRS